MLSEEEKKAIEYWKRDISLYHYNTQLCSEHYAQIILNLIEKQSKEIAQKDNIIDAMAEQLTTPVHNKRWVIDYFEEKSK